MSVLLGASDVHLPRVWATHARFSGEKAAILDGDKVVSWSDFNEQMNRFANALIGAGLGRGANVAVVMGNRAEMMAVLFGTVKAAACVVPLSTLLTSQQLLTLITDSGASALVADSATRDLIEPVRAELSAILPGLCIALDFAGEGWTAYADFVAGASSEEPLVDFDLADRFNIIYSSGTTGLPKGIVQSHRARQHWSWSNGVTFGIGGNSVSLVTTSLYSNGTWLTVLPTMLSGGTVVLMDRFTPDAFCTAVRRYGVTHSFLVPTQFQALLEFPGLDDADFSSLEMLLSAGSPLRETTRSEAEVRICPRIFELYGFSEGFATVIRPEDAARKAGSVGKPVIGFDMRIIDDEGALLGPCQPGEIVGTGAGMMDCYHNQPELTASLTWHDERGRSYIRSGDIGQIDEEGFLTIIDRKKDMILSGGFNIFPADLEAIIAQHPEVSDVTVIGIPDPHWGETPLALVIPLPGTTPDPEGLRAFANQRLAKTQRISRVELREDFPRNALGKVLKRQLRESYWVAQA